MKWINNSRLPNIINLDINKTNDDLARRFLLEYLKSYQNTYPFDRLELPYKYLNDHLKNIISHDTPTEEKAKQHIEEGMYEYCFSLNEISSSAHRLLDKKPLTPSCILSCLDKILEAYSCNESKELF